jgi:hypothetical protein
MPGPLPKPSAQRRRRNAINPPVSLPKAGRVGRPPKPHCDVEWGEHARAYRTALWSSPMAAAYVKTDTFALTRLCCLVDERDRFQRGELASFDGDAEIRQLEDRFGLSPLARRRLQWEIEESEQRQLPPSDEGQREYDELLARRLARPGG